MINQVAESGLQFGIGPKAEDASDAFDDFLLAKAEVEAALGVEEEKTSKVPRQEGIAQLFEMVRVFDAGRAVEAVRVGVPDWE